MTFLGSLIRELHKIAALSKAEQFPVSTEDHGKSFVNDHRSAAHRSPAFIPKAFL
jgi:hypothetical protein